jgi:hypothetical protein
MLTVPRANAFMNSWNSDFVYEGYERSTLGSLTHFNGKTQLHPARVANAFRKLVSEGADKDDPQTLKKAQDPSCHVVNPRMPFETLNWGTFTMMLSELGKDKELNDLLQYLDEKLNPTWENGGLFYPRNDHLADEQWNLTHVEPHSGNSGVGYARLNIKDGQRKMWERPWTSDVLASRPYIEGPVYADDIDFLRGVWDEDNSAMILTMRRWQGASRPQSITVKNLPKGDWAVFIDEDFSQQTSVDRGGSISLTCDVGQEAVDVVVERGHRQRL